MDINSRYRVNAPNVVGETIDGETVIVNMETGAYFTTLGTGARIWEWIAQGASVRQITQQLMTEYEGDMMEMSFAVAPFVSQLVEQRLIMPMMGDASPAMLQAANTEKTPFSTPTLDVYRDMQNLLMIDPIHEVDTAQGWPLPKSSA